MKELMMLRLVGDEMVGLVKRGVPIPGGTVELEVGVKPRVNRLFSEYKLRITREVISLGIAGIRLHPNVRILNNCKVQIMVTELDGNKTARLNTEISTPREFFMDLDADHVVAGLRTPSYLSEVRRSISHELIHHTDSSVAFRTKVMDRIEKVFDKGNIPEAAVLFYLAIIELRTEGLAGFEKVRNADSVMITARSIYAFKRRISELTKLEGDQKKLFRFYITKIRGDLQAMGMLMCVTIALSLLEKNEVHMILPGGKWEMLRSLDKSLKKFTSIYLTRIPDKVFAEVYEMVRGAKPRKFIQLYEKACNKLRISYKNRVIWWRLFMQWKKEAVGLQTKLRKIKIEQAGFVSMN